MVDTGPAFLWEVTRRLHRLFPASFVARGLRMVRGPYFANVELLRLRVVVRLLTGVHVYYRVIIRAFSSVMTHATRHRRGTTIFAHHRGHARHARALNGDVEHREMGHTTTLPFQRLRRQGTRRLDATSYHRVRLLHLH